MVETVILALEERFGDYPLVPEGQGSAVTVNGKKARLLPARRPPFGVAAETPALESRMTLAIRPTTTCTMATGNTKSELSAGTAQETGSSSRERVARDVRCEQPGLERGQDALRDVEQSAGVVQIVDAVAGVGLHELEVELRHLIPIQVAA